MNRNSTIYIAGSSGMVGSTIVRHLKYKGYANILAPSHKELELADPVSVDVFFVKRNQSM